MSGGESDVRRTNSAAAGHQVFQAGGNFNSTVTHVRNDRGTGWVVLAVLVTAAVGALGVYAVAGERTAGGSGDRASSAGSGPGGQAPEAASEGTSEAAPDATPEAAPDAAPETAPDAPPGEQWRGALRLGIDGMELDANPPSKGTSMLGSDLALGYLGTLNAMTTGGGTVAPWQDAGREPGHGDCAELADTVGSSMAPVRQGTVLCVRTDEGRVARLTVTDIVGDISPAAEVDAVVWQLAR
ncbi:hypothetical protein AB0K92_29600 [Streptomyces sp. NPDC052687]|uniref:hypothetical protein n=1 Tax=Streptomyces sp. NPDC052687 TaxID=3154759 RepID=UPI00343D8F0D